MVPFPRARRAVLRVRWAVSLWPAVVVAAGVVAAAVWIAAAVLLVLVFAAGLLASIEWPAPFRAWRRARWVLWAWPWTAAALGLGVRCRAAGRDDLLLVPLVLRSTPWWFGDVAGVDVVVRLLPGQSTGDVDRFAEGLRLRWAVHVEVHRSGRVHVVRIVLDDDPMGVAA